MFRLLLASAVVLQLAFFGSGFQIHPRVMNGVLSNPRDYPFFVSLTTSNGMYCGGTLISDKWVVTAAHCFAKKQPFVVQFGLDEKGVSRQNISAEASSLHIYPFNKGLELDIALVELPQKVQLTDYIQPVRLAVDSIPHAGNEPVAMVGRGAVDPRANTFAEIPDRRIRHADLVTVPENQFVAEVKSDSHHPQYPVSVVCTRSRNSHGSGIGDSGGPLIRKRDGAFLGVVGVRLFMDRKSYVPTHVFFAFMPHYYSWIAKTTGLEMPKVNGPQARLT